MLKIGWFSQIPSFATPGYEKCERRLRLTNLDTLELLRIEYFDVLSSINCGHPRDCGGIECSR